MWHASVARCAHVCLRSRIRENPVWQSVQMCPWVSFKFQTVLLKIFTAVNSTYNMGNFKIPQLSKTAFDITPWQYNIPTHSVIVCRQALRRIICRLFSECPKGHYQHEINIFSTCRACPATQTTVSAGATAMSQCICADGYWNAGDHTSKPPCVGNRSRLPSSTALPVLCFLANLYA